MCAPMALGLIGAAVSAASSIASGIAAKQSADYQAEVAKQNAIAANKEGLAQAGATRDQFAAVKGAQVAALAKSGVDVNSGTSAVLGLETQRREETAAAVDIWRGRSEQTKYLNQADAAKAEGKAAMTAGIIGAGSSLIGGISGLVGSGGLGQGSALKLGQAHPMVTGSMGKTTIPIPKPKPLIPVGKQYSLTGTVYG